MRCTDSPLPWGKVLQPVVFTHPFDVLSCMYLRAQHISANNVTGCLSDEHMQVLGHPDWQLMRDLTSLETQDLLSRYQSKLMSNNRESQASMSALSPS